MNLYSIRSRCRSFHKRLAWLLSCVFILFSIKPYAHEQVISFSLATAEAPPYVYLSENNQIKGTLINKLERAQKDSALKIEILIMPWARALNEVKQNRIDAIMPTLWSEDRAKYLEYPNLPFYSGDESVLIKRASDDFEFNELSNIPSNKVIGKIRLVVINAAFDKLVKQGKLRTYETPKLDQVLLMLAQKKIDLVASEGSIAATTIKNLGLEGTFKTYSLHVDSTPAYMAFSPNFAAKYDINKIMDIIIRQSTSTK